MKKGLYRLTALFCLIISLCILAGSRFDPEESGNTLSYNMLKNAVDRLSYRYDPDAELPNITEIMIRG